MAAVTEVGNGHSSAELTNGSAPNVIDDFRARKVSIRAIQEQTVTARTFLRDRGLSHVPVKLFDTLFEPLSGHSGYIKVEEGPGSFKHRFDASLEDDMMPVIRKRLAQIAPHIPSIPRTWTERRRYQRLAFRIHTHGGSYKERAYRKASQKEVVELLHKELQWFFRSEGHREIQADMFADRQLDKVKPWIEGRTGAFEDYHALERAVIAGARNTARELYAQMSPTQRAEMETRRRVKIYAKLYAQGGTDIELSPGANRIIFLRFMEGKSAKEISLLDHQARSAGALRQVIKRSLDQLYPDRQKAAGGRKRLSGRKSPKT